MNLTYDCNTTIGLLHDRGIGACSPTTQKLCDSTIINLPYNLPPIEYCAIPAFQNIIAAIIIIISIYVAIRIYRDIKKGKIKLE